MLTRVVAGGVVVSVCSFILVGCGGSDDSPSPSPPSPPAPTPPSPSPSPPAPSPSPPSTTTHTTTVGCRPGNELDKCVCDYCSKEESCTTLGHIGCDNSLCSWIPDNSSTHGGKCQSPHATTTTTTTPATGCEPQTATDMCFMRGRYASSEADCVALGPIGCQHQVCHYFALPNGTEACGSRHATTTEGPCVPATDTDKCFSKCKSYCTNATSCETLGPQGCGGAACTWKDNTCQSLSAFIELV